MKKAHVYMFLALGLVFLLACTNKENSSTATTPNTKPYAHELNLPDENAQITRSGEQYQLNIIDERSAQNFDSIHKRFFLRSHTRQGILFDREVFSVSQCRIPQEINIDRTVTISSIYGLQNLTQNLSVMLEANVDYIIDVRISNKGECNSMYYSFALNSSRDRVKPPKDPRRPSPYRP